MSWFDRELLFDKPFVHGISFSFGLGGSKGGSSSSSKTDIDTTKTEDKKSTSKGTKTASTTGTQKSNQKTSGQQSKTSELGEDTNLSQLDEGTQNVLKGLIADIAAKQGGGSDLSSLLSSRALNADSAFADLIDPQVAESRRQQEIELGQTVQKLSRATGGGVGSNSLVANFDLEGQRAIETSVASLAATLGIDARTAATEEITGALEAKLGEENINSSSVAALANVLKGAQQTGTKTISGKEDITSVEDVIGLLESATTETELNDIIESLSGITNVKGTEKSVGSGSTKEKGFGLGIANSF